MQKLIRRAGKSLRTSLAVLRRPPYHTPGHYYSPITSQSDINRAKAMRSDLAALDGINLNSASQLNLATTTLAPMWAQIETVGPRYRLDNRMYGLADGAVYYSMLRHLRPDRVVEVGSGFSSALALDVRDQHMTDLDLTFIEPYPARLLGLLSPTDQDRVKLIRHQVQDVPVDVYKELASDDILFVDSTHVAKAGSDVNWLFFKIFPMLQPGVVIHLHDIFFPFEYTDEWLDQGRSWNENYLLRSFLTYNDAFEVMLFNSWLWSEHSEIIRRHLPGALYDSPGSIWLRKVR